MAAAANGEAALATVGQGVANAQLDIAVAESFTEEEKFAGKGEDYYHDFVGWGGDDVIYDAAQVDDV